MGLHYLGRSGVMDILGLKVAFLDGTYNAAAFTSINNEEQTETTSRGCSRYYTCADVDNLKAALKTVEGDVDILLTHEWPLNLLYGLPQDSKLSEEPLGIAVLADIASLARPRYHFAGGQQVFYDRAPYINPDLGAGSHVTRFVSLADVGNNSKQKWLHALALKPASQMEPEALSAVPAGSTGFPFSSQAIQAGKRSIMETSELGAQTWRWQEHSKRPKLATAAPSLGRKDVVKDRSKTIFVRNVPFRANEEDLVAFFSQAGQVVDVVRRTTREGKLNTFCHVQYESREAMERACQLNLTEFMGRQLAIEPAAGTQGVHKRAVTPAPAVEGCWFCLSNSNADTSLVASVGEEAYLALDKGAITDDHVLILPVEHYPCALDASIGAATEIDRYVSALRSFYASKGKEIVGFERYMRFKKTGGNHCHLNFIAISRTAAQESKKAFEEAGQQHGLNFAYLPPAAGEEAWETVRENAGNGEYFVAFLPDGARLVHPITPGVQCPLNFGREVLARLAGVPHRADWKACQQNPEEEAARTARFRSAFSPFDIMQQ